MGTALVVVAFLISGSGCQATGRYFKNRLGDVSEILRGEVGFPAVGVYAEATPLFNAGLDVWLAYGENGGSAGNFNSRVPEVSEFAAYSVLFFHARGFDTDPETTDPFDDKTVEPTHAGTVTHVHQLGRAFETNAPKNLRPLHWLDVETDIAVGVGLRIQVSPGEFIDFFLGWFGVDLGGDDETEAESGPETESGTLGATKRSDQR